MTYPCPCHPLPAQLLLLLLLLLLRPDPRVALRAEALIPTASPTWMDKTSYLSFHVIRDTPNTGDVQCGEKVNRCTTTHNPCPHTNRLEKGIKRQQISTLTLSCASGTDPWCQQPLAEQRTWCRVPLADQPSRWLRNAGT